MLRGDYLPYLERLTGSARILGMGAERLQAGFDARARIEIVAQRVPEEVETQHG